MFGIGTTKIGLIIRPHVEQALTVAAEFLAWSQTKKIQIYLEEETSTFFSVSGAQISTAAEIVKTVEFVVVLGGDGTLFRVARHVCASKPILLGVNFGNLGFLTELAPAELIPVLESALAGKLKPGERHMLQAKVYRENKQIFSSQAVNDVVVQKGAQDPLLELDVAVEQDDLVRVRADGVIICTPTGSTAYSLAAGGSIVYPMLASMMLTPICAHSLSMRPIILPMYLALTVSIPAYNGKVVVTVDGQVSEFLKPGDTVRITQSPHTVKFAQSPSKGYFEILRGKLNWGIANK